MDKAQDRLTDVPLEDRSGKLRPREVKEPVQGGPGSLAPEPTRDAAMLVTDYTKGQLLSGKIAALLDM